MHAITQQKVLDELARLAASWHDAEMQPHLRGARTLALQLVIDMSDDRPLTSAEALVDAVIAEARKPVG